MNKIYFDTNRISLFNAGRVVYVVDADGVVIDVGHVDSFGLNSNNEVVVFVKTARSAGRSIPYHPAFLSIAKP